MYHLWKKPFNIKCLSLYKVCKTPESNMSRKKKPAVILSNEVECDEAYVTAGHKGQPEVVKSKERTGRRRRLQGKAVVAPWRRKDRPSLGCCRVAVKGSSISWPT
jgi:hypothetical protein